MKKNNDENLFKNIFIAVPVYISTLDSCRIPLFERALNSIIRQRERNLNTIRIFTIIVDDNSPIDVVFHISEMFRLKNPDTVYLKRNKPENEIKGASSALNTAIKFLLNIPDNSLKSVCGSIDISTPNNSIFCYLHSDDELTPDSIQYRIDVLNKPTFVKTPYNLLYGGLIVLINDKKKTFRYFSFTNFTLLRIYFYLSDYAPDHTLTWGVTFLKEVVEYCHSNFRQYGYQYGDVFDPRISHMEDTDASLTSIKVAQLKGGSIQSIKEPLYIYTDYGIDSLSSQENIPGSVNFNNKSFAREEIPCKQFKVPLVFPYTWIAYLKKKDILIEKFGGHIFLKVLDIFSSWIKKFYDSAEKK